jgi:hypothetical protein
MNYHDIRSLLDTQLQTVSDLPSLQTENSRLELIGNKKTPWVRSTLLPAEPVDLNVGHIGKVSYRGLYQVDLMYPMGASAADANAMAAEVTDALPRGYMQTIGTGILQIDMSWQEAASIMDTWYVVPVVVRWVVYA